jgi:DNA-binding transcriptional LysR family regulator
MDLTKLKYFQVVAEKVNIRGAAKALAISSSALSKAIKQLEIDLNLKLLTADGRGIALTDDGKATYQLATRLLKQFDDFKEGVATRSTLDSTKRIATYGLFSNYFLSQVFAHEFMDQGFDVHELGPGAIENALLQGVVDIGITSAPAPHAKLKFLPVGQSTLSLYKRVGSFRDQSYLEIPACTPISPVEGWPLEAFGRKTQYRVGSIETALEICSLGLASGYFPDFLVQLYNLRVCDTLRLEPLALSKSLKPKSMTLYLVRRKSDEDDTLARKLAKSIRSACRNAHGQC